MISTYQRAEACRIAVESALSQTLPALEVIVGDDGSTDATADIFEEWITREPRLSYIRLSANRGTPAWARNAAIEAARGEWIAFLDDDDVWFPSKLACQARLLRSDAFDVVASNARRTDGLPYFPVLDAAILPTRDNVLRDNPIIFSTAVVRRSSLLRAGGIKTDLVLAGVEDYCLWIDLALAGARFAVESTELAVYESASPTRLSVGASARQQRAIASYVARRSLARPFDRGLALIASAHFWRAVKLTIRGVLGR